jgi:phosphopantothenoylcysteine decarboxylase/phosphopantothenate--cysteine ligase
MAGGRVLLAVSASVAIHRALDITSELRKRGRSVRVLMTPRATQLISPLQFSALSGEAVIHDLFDPTGRAAYEHLEAARTANLLVAAPATADLMARLAAGLADDAVTTAALAYEGPRILCPAMNWRMWKNPLTQRNTATLEALGWQRIGPESGELGCGEDGDGRLASVPNILAAIEAALS